MFWPTRACGLAAYGLKVKALEWLREPNEHLAAPRDNARRRSIRGQLAKTSRKIDERLDPSLLPRARQGT